MTDTPAFQNYVPDVSALDTTATGLEVDPDTKVRPTSSSTIVVYSSFAHHRTSSAQSEWTQSASMSSTQHSTRVTITAEEALQALVVPVVLEGTNLGSASHASLCITIVVCLHWQGQSDEILRESCAVLEKDMREFVLMADGCCQCSAPRSS